MTRQSTRQANTPITSTKEAEHQRELDRLYLQWRRFKLGLAWFCLAVVLILVGSQRWYWLQLPGLVALAIGAFFAARGYLGILMYRLRKGIKTPPPDF